MFRSIIWYSNFALTLVGTLPRLFKVNRLDKKIKSSENPSTEDIVLREELVFDTVSKWAENKIKIAGATVKICGEENIPKDETVLFMSNHQSNFDIALFLSYIKTNKGFVAKKELSKVPILNTWMEKIDCIFMDRSNMRASAQAIAESTKLLKKGRSMVIFPEGTRSCKNELLEFKAGSFKLATKSKVKIVPVTIKNSYKLMEENNNRITPAKVEIYIHPPVETKGLSKEEEDALPSKIKGIIESKLH
ncbi:MAG: lysophospholipid acyltransferase family protein [Clostridium sp.]|uniref:lysophospholipid acyltransferase family protein n=1 Tax=Clostridium sp. TaxID=1506 RepID=UPI002FCAF081